MMLDDVLARKQGFLGDKNVVLPQSKNQHLSMILDTKLKFPFNLVFFEEDYDNV